MRFLLIALLAMTGLSGCLSDDGAEADDIVTGVLPEDPVHESITFQETLAVTAGTDHPVGGCGVEGTVDTAETTWTIDAPAGANDTHVVDMVLTFSWAATQVDVDFLVYGPGGDELASSTAFNAGQDSETLPVDGRHPVGDFRIVVVGCVGTGDVSIDGAAVLGYVPAAATA